MNATAIRKPLIKQGWLRVLLFCIFYVLLILLSSIPAVYLIKSIKGNTDNIQQLFNGEFLWLTILIAVAVGLLAVFLFRLIIDRKSLVSLGFNFSGYLNDAISGFLLAISILGIGTMIL